MATKTEKAVKRAVQTEKKRSKERQELMILRTLLALIVLLLLFLWLADRYGWWPYQRPDLGTAFYTNVSTSPTSTTTTNGSTTPSSSGSTTSTGATGSSGSNGSNGTSGSSGSSGSTGGSSSSPATPSLLSFSAGVNDGDSKAQISDAATGLDQNCAVLVTTAAAGQEQVCTYTQGDKVVTVTYLNGNVVSASKSGF